MKLGRSFRAVVPGTTAPGPAAAAPTQPVARPWTAPTPLPHLEQALVAHASAPSAAGLGTDVLAAALDLQPDPAAREALARALLKASRASAAHLMGRLRGLREIVASAGSWGAARSALAEVLDPVRRLHPRTHAALTRRSLRWRLFRHDPARSAKLDQDLPSRSVQPPRLSTLEARILVEAHAQALPAALKSQLLRHLEQALDRTRVPQHQTIVGREPATWIDSHPVPEQLRASLLALRDAAPAPGGEEANARVRACIDAVVADIDAVLAPMGAHPQDHPLHLDRMASDASDALWAAGIRVAGAGDGGDGRAALQGRVRQALEPDAQSGARTQMRVLREHLTPDQLRDIDAQCAGAPSAGSSPSGAGPSAACFASASGHVRPRPCSRALTTLELQRCPRAPAGSRWSS